MDLNELVLTEEQRLLFQIDELKERVYELEMDKERLNKHNEELQNKLLDNKKLLILAKSILEKVIKE